MAHRTQITLTDRQYERLRAESRRNGLGLAELIRRAVDRTYGWTSNDAMSAALDSSAGCWSAREDDLEDGAAYVERIRHGMAGRLAPS